MLLQTLRDFADERMELPPRLYGVATVRYIIDLTIDGQLLHLTDLANATDRRQRHGQRMLMPQIARGTDITPLLMASNAEYTLGLAREADQQSRVARCHAAYLDQIDRCAAATGEPAVHAVRTFLRDNPLDLLPIDGMNRGAAITFRVDGILPVDLPAVQEFWADEHDPAARSAPVMQCLVCGEDRPVLERMQAKVKGVPGGQSSGTALVSANKPSAWSYGLFASLNSPICAECAEKITIALNYLLANDAHRLYLGNAVCVVWTREPVEDEYLRLLVDAPESDVRALLTSVWAGRPVPNERVRCYGVVLSATGGRSVVRSWLDTTVGGMREALARWFAWQRLGDDRPLGLRALAGATVRDLADVSTSSLTHLCSAALYGTPVPHRLLAAVVARCRATQTVTRPHAAVIKMVFCSNQMEDCTKMERLDPEDARPAYLLGRMLSVLDNIQLAANGRGQIASRYYATASSAPVSVFPRLLALAHHHLTKLDRDKPRAAYALRHRLDGIAGTLPAFPITLTLHEQGLFAMGYYHQIAYDRAQRNAAIARKRAATAADAAGVTDVTDVTDVASDDDDDIFLLSIYN